MKKKNTILSVCAALLAGTVAFAQAPDSLSVGTDSVALSGPVRPVEAMLRTADSLRIEYRFEEAVAQYAEALRYVSDSLRQQVDDAMLQAQNGRNMLAYCSQPAIVARERFSLKDFFLFYPLRDRSWRAVPNQLDSLEASDLVRAMYLPEDADRHYYAATDAQGIHNLYSTERQDTVWTAPQLINENLTSSSDEIYPMLSPDGNSLYFASKGLYGMGGYDLYVSRWNSETRDWDTPVNLGFPYSSPADDFLFVNTPDGKYSVFASNRDCSRDSVWVYVLEYDAMPVRRAMSGGAEIKNLSRLLPVRNPAQLETRGAVSGIQENVDTRRYSEEMRRVRALRENIFTAGQDIDDLRADLAEASETERRTLSAAILEQESALAVLQDSLRAASARLQQIEMDFLLKGVVIDPDRIQQEADRQIVGVTSGFTFSRKTLGAPLTLNLLAPVFDYTFMILPEGRFAEDNTLPDGLVYQIQLFTTSTPATVDQLKGISPVFARTAQGRHTYAAGIFRTYQDVLANLNSVKRQGFRNAFIVAFEDGKSISVAQARQKEKTQKAQYIIRILPADGNSLGDGIVTVIRSVTLKDLSKEVDDGEVSYVLGPFDDRAEADRILSSLRTAGVSSAAVESVTP